LLVLAHMFVRRLVVQDLIAPRVTAFTVIPGTCNSSLFRNLPAPFSWIWFLLMLVFARTPEQGARVVVNALLDGRDPSDLGSAVVNNGQLTADSDFLLSARGRELEGQVWVRIQNLSKTTNSSNISRQRSLIYSEKWTGSFAICVRETR
jgi:hypothetical protein